MQRGLIPRRSVVDAEGHQTTLERYVMAGRRPTIALTYLVRVNPMKPPAPAATPTTVEWTWLRLIALVSFRDRRMKDRSMKTTHKNSSAETTIAYVAA